MPRVHEGVFVSKNCLCCCFVSYIVLWTVKGPKMLYVFRQGDLPKLDLNVDCSSDFKAWKSQWHAYYSLYGLDGQSNTNQVHALTLCFLRATVTIVDNLGLTSEQRRKVTEIIAAIERYVQAQINESVEWRNFRWWVQQEGETSDDFFVSLRELAKTYTFYSEESMQKNIHDKLLLAYWMDT